MFKVNSFEELALICKVVAKCVGTQIEIREYKNLARPWASICFMTDHFGGIHTMLHYDYGTGNLRKDFGTPKEFDVCDIKELFDIVKADYEHELKVRDMAGVAEFINSQY